MVSVKEVLLLILIIILILGFIGIEGKLYMNALNSWIPKDKEEEAKSREDDKQADTTEQDNQKADGLEQNSEKAKANDK